LEIINPDVIARARSGDSCLISVICQLCRQGVFRYLYDHIGDEATESLTSEICLYMIGALGGYRLQTAGYEARLYQTSRS